MKRSIRNVLTVICAILVFALFIPAVTGIVNNAKADEAESLTIAYNNLAFQDNVYILYAVDSTGIENKEEIKILIWKEPQTEYEYGTQDKILTYNRTMEINGEDYPVFILDSLSAKEMTDEVYAVAYYDGIYSAPNKYSILQYAKNTIKNSENEALKTLLRDMLQYGASAQVFYGYKTDRLANETYYSVSVENGKLSDGFTNGVYKSGEEITVIANAPDENKVFKRWVDENGNILGTESNLIYGLDKDTIVTAEYGLSATPDEYFTFTLLDNDTYEIAAKDKNDLPAEIVLPSTYNGKAVTSIGENSFYNCSKLTSITIPDSVTRLELNAFRRCIGLTSIIIPDSVTTIGNYAFYDCYNITNVVISESVASIGSNAFSACSLYYIINKSNLQLTFGSTNNGSVAYNAKAIEDKDGNVTYKDDTVFIENDFIYEKVSNEYRLISYIGKEDTVTLPLTYKGNKYTTYHIRGVKNVIIPQGVAIIENGAFYNCSSLISISIPDSVTNIGDYAFYGCRLMSVTYNGTKAQWGTITKGYEWNYDVPWICKLYCTDGYNIGLKSVVK